MTEVRLGVFKYTPDSVDCPMVGVSVLAFMRSPKHIDDRYGYTVKRIDEMYVQVYNKGQEVDYNHIIAEGDRIEIHRSERTPSFGSHSRRPSLLKRWLH